MFRQLIVRGLVFLGVLTVPGLAQAVVIIGDTEFPLSDWSATELVDTGANGIMSVSQQSTGGNPGAFRRGQHVWGPGLVQYGHLHTAQTYDPSTQGAITTIDWSYDFIVLAVTNPTDGAVGSLFMLEQGGIAYVTGPALSPFIDPDGNRGTVIDPAWLTNFNSDLTSAAFSRVDGAPGNPDFSASGGVISFGFETLNSTGQADGRTTLWGIDNWEVVIHQEGDQMAIPAPGALALFAFGLALLGVLARRRLAA